MSKVSIVIRCYNEEQHIGRLLSGLIQQTAKDLEIIVVDSGSTDSTVSIASRYPIKLLSIKPEEFSFGRALNLGCEAATGEFIVIVSAHVYPEYQDWLEKLIAPFDDPDIALTYGKQRGNETTKYAEQQIFMTWFPDHKTIVDQTHPFCNNANAAIRRSLWKQIPYDESLTGLEDLDWAKKAIALGYRITYVPEAEIIHVHDETPKRIYNRYRREAIALKHIYPQEYFYFRDFLRLFITNLISDYFHAWHDRVLISNFFSIPIFRLMQFWGTYQGFTQQGMINIQLKQTFYYPRRLSRQNQSSQLDQNRPTIDYSNHSKPLEKI
ncbi:glycosyltransferase [Crocosphaera sp. XPORK-15E]|uniref:glycosyltransferase n=1 Tax=Crocosphaera sp. XPORK-15E TaxID=3110247 RepID=UPI002B2151F1|nr:glycosyltransferase [Crocosphaera sp. XPORK-15E]MEA5533265.1 glycosyltransferase [Crocosphaera sp. XPORK-15E]